METTWDIVPIVMYIDFVESTFKLEAITHKLSTTDSKMLNIGFELNGWNSFQYWWASSVSIKDMIAYIISFWRRMRFSKIFP